MNGVEAEPVNLSARGKELTELLLTNPDITMVEAQRLMGITHKSWFYKIRDSLVNAGVLHPAEDAHLPEPFTTRMAHPQQSTRRPSHAPVRHVWWSDTYGHWAVQGALLDRWDLRSWPEALPDEVAVVLRYVNNYAPERPWQKAWTANRRQRWTIERTDVRTGPPSLSPDQLKTITLAVAWVLDTDAVIPPGAAAREIPAD